MEFSDVLVVDNDRLANLALNDEDVPYGVDVQAHELELQQQREFPSSAWNDIAAFPLECLLNDIVLALQPTNDDYAKRLEIVQLLSNMINSLEGLRGVAVVPFGSFESKLYTRWGDLDLSLELPECGKWSPPAGKKKKVKVLRLVQHILIKQGEICNVQLIPHARVPLLTFKNTFSGISCDLSIDNGVALLKSRLLRWISDMDPRCRSLIFLVKCWAKAHCINNAKLGTLNSFALCLLVVFHLQTRSPPILPPLNAVIHEDIVANLTGLQSRHSREQLLEKCRGNIQSFIRNAFGTDNKSSVAGLFASFFWQFSSVSDLWQRGLAVCTFTGTWSDTTTENWRNKKYVMNVKDPFCRSENCARSVQEGAFLAIKHAFFSTAESLCLPPAYCTLPSLRESLFCWPLGNPSPGTGPKSDLAVGAGLTSPYTFWCPHPRAKVVNDKKNKREQGHASNSTLFNRGSGNRLDEAPQKTSHPMHSNVIEKTFQDHLHRTQLHVPSMKDDSEIGILDNLYDSTSNTYIGLSNGMECITLHEIAAEDIGTLTPVKLRGVDHFIKKGSKLMEKSSSKAGEILQQSKVDQPTLLYQLDTHHQNLAMHYSCQSTGQKIVFADDNTTPKYAALSIERLQEKGIWNPIGNEDGTVDSEETIYSIMQSVASSSLNQSKQGLEEMVGHTTLKKEKKKQHIPTKLDQRQMTTEGGLQKREEGGPCSSKLFGSKDRVNAAGNLVQVHTIDSIMQSVASSGQKQPKLGLAEMLGHTTLKNEKKKQHIPTKLDQRQMTTERSQRREPGGLCSSKPFDLKDKVDTASSHVQVHTIYNISKPEASSSPKQPMQGLEELEGHITLKTEKKKQYIPTKLNQNQMTTKGGSWKREQGGPCSSKSFDLNTASNLVQVHTKEKNDINSLAKTKDQRKPSDCKRGTRQQQWRPKVDICSFPGSETKW